MSTLRSICETLRGSTREQHPRTPIEQCHAGLILRKGCRTAKIGKTAWLDGQSSQTAALIQKRGFAKKYAKTKRKQALSFEINMKMLKVANVDS